MFICLILICARFVERPASDDIPKRRLTVFTGVSGSGKSALVFGTIAAESQRLINETYSAFLQGYMPALAAAFVGNGLPYVTRRRGAGSTETSRVKT